MGAFLLALSLTISLAIANLLGYLLSSYSIPLLFVAVIPMWLFIGFILRKSWMLKKKGMK